MKRFLIFLPVFFFMHTAFGQDSAVMKHTRKIGVLPVPTFGYEPETRFFVGAVALFTFRHWSDSLTRFSTAKTELTYTQNHQFVVELGCNIFTPKEKFNIEVSVGWKRFPEYWWGMGNHSPDSAKELYDARRLETDMRFTKQVRPHLFVGFRYRLQNIYHISDDAGLALDVLKGPDVAGGVYSGIGPSFSYDTRKNILNPQEGFFAHTSILGFSNLTFSHSNFLRIETDVRKYWALRKKKDVLAIQFYSLLNPGNPPFRLTGMMGSDREMRGYYQGRYRDQYYVTAQAEYRMHLFWRLGATVFAGAGTISGKYGAFDPTVIKPTYGGGLRILMDKKDNINLRLDFAFGNDCFGFYAAFGEAF